MGSCKGNWEVFLRLESINAIRLAENCIKKHTPRTCNGLHQRIEGALNVEDAAAGDVGVAFGGAEAGMAEKGLDVPDVGAAFQ